MSHERVKVSGVLEIEHILEFEMRQQAGSHAWARLRGILTDEEVNKLGLSLERETVLIYDNETGEEIFHGIIDVAELRSENGYNTVELELLAGSWLLDLEKKSQSFQDVNMTYREVIEAVLEEYPMAATIIADEMGCSTLGKPVIRYRETAWEFVGRLASHFNLPVFSDVRAGTPRVYVGVPERHKQAEFSNAQYEYSIGEAYMAAGGMFSGLRKSDFARYDVKTGINYQLGFETVFQDMELTICGKSCVLERDVYVYTYLLANRKYCYVRKRYNALFLGMSLLGRVIQREGEHIRIHYEIDETQEVTTAYRYPWKPETGNLMYLMPQIGSRVSVYFGSDDESEGIATVNVRDNAPPVPARGVVPETEQHPEPEPELELEPDSIVRDFVTHGHRGVTTEHSKIFSLHPQMLTLSSGRYLNIIMNRHGLNFRSNKGITIIAKNEIRITGSSVKIEGKEDVYIGEGEAGSDEAGVIDIKSGLHLFADGHPLVQLGALGDPVGGIRYLGRSRRLQDPNDEFDDEMHERPLEWGKIAANIAIGAGVVVVVGALVVFTGGKILIVKPLLSGAVKKVTVSVLITGNAYVLKQAVSDVIGGEASHWGKYAEAAFRGSIVGLMNGAIKAAGMKAALESFVTGTAEDALNQFWKTGDVKILEAMFAGSVSVVSSIATDRIYSALPARPSSNNTVDRVGLRGIAGQTSGETTFSWYRDVLGEVGVEARNKVTETVIEGLLELPQPSES